MVWLLTFRVPPNCTVHVASRTFPLYPGSTSIACSLLKEAVDFARANNLECIFAYSSQWKSRRCEKFGKWKWELNPYVCSFYDLRRFSQQIYVLSVSRVHLWCMCPCLLVVYGMTCVLCIQAVINDMHILQKLQPYHQCTCTNTYVCTYVHTYSMWRL